MTNHFSLLNLTPVYGIDPAALEAAYFEAQRKFHPDRFVGKLPEERQAATQRSVDINNAYNALKDPLTRAQYLLRMQNVTVGTDHDTIKPSPSVLMEAMALRESPPPRETLAKLIAASTDAIGAAFIKGDYAAMAQETIRLGYLLKARK